MFLILTGIGGLLLGLFISWMVYFHFHRKLNQRLQFSHLMLSQMPAGLFYQDLHDAHHTFISQLLANAFHLKNTAQWAQILEKFAGEDQTQLQNSYQLLQKTGQSFSHLLTTSDTTFHFVVTGQVVHNAHEHALIIMFFDVSDLARKLQLSNLLERHKNILAAAMESLPFPLFIRDSKGLSFFANTSVNQEKTSTLNDLNWLSFSFQAANEFFTLTYGQETKTEEELRIILENIITAQRRLCAQLPCAVCLFNAAGKMLACSPQFAKLWQLKKTWIDSEPNYEDFWDTIQDSGLLSRVADFADYKRQQRENFARLSEVNQLFLYLPSGKIIQRTMIPYVQGSVILLDEEQT